MHMIRNAVEHGLEPTEERIKAGKPETGSIFLEATQLSDGFQIKIADDGAGIDFSKLLNKALEKNLVNDPRTLTPKTIKELIFLPGLSTAEKVTEISGRGVGMDVVKTNIESVGGRIEVDSQAGAGTEFTIILPKKG